MRRLSSILRRGPGAARERRSRDLAGCDEDRFGRDGDPSLDDSRAVALARAEPKADRLQAMATSTLARESAPATAKAPGAGRLDHVDLLRGLVIVLMAIDHVRHVYHLSAFDPTDLAHTTAPVFLTRWITHFCAPVFVFLAGAGAFLYGSRGRTRGEVSRFLSTRGLWLVLLELTWVRFSWFFDPELTHMMLQVIWALGVSMIVLAGLVWLPLRVTVAIGIAMIALHNLLDPIAVELGGPVGVLWALIHRGGSFTFDGGWALRVRYPLVPWIGVMAAGYGFGAVLLKPREERRRVVLALGIASCVLFVALRATNLYGDPRPWSEQASAGFTVLSFLNCEKYPPSLCYLLMTLGPALVFLALTDREVPSWLAPLVTFGRVPLFFYLLHIPLIFGTALIVARVWFVGVPEQEIGFGLPGTYVAWFAIVAFLYVPCRWFAGVKQRRRDPWLSYL
jgi:uncharacterized membrane protein